MAVPVACRLSFSTVGLPIRFWQFHKRHETLDNVVSQSSSMQASSARPSIRVSMYL